MLKELKMLFEGTNVEIINEGGNILFEIYSTGMALGYVAYGKNKNNPLPYKSRIEKILKNAEIKGCSHGVNTYMNQQELYDFMLESHTSKCKSFRKWVTTEVLPTINETGGYVEQNQEKEFVENYFPSLSDDTKKLIIVDLQKKNEELLKENKELSVDADMARNLMNRKGLLTLKQVADNIEIGRTTLCSLLREKKILSKQTGYNEPMGKYIKSPYFKTVVEENEKTKYASVVTLVTPKGLKFIYRLIKRNQLLDDFDTTSLLEVQA